MSTKRQSFGKALSLLPLTYNRKLLVLDPSIRSNNECLDFLLAANTALHISWKTTATGATCSAAATSENPHSKSLAYMAPSSALTSLK